MLARNFTETHWAPADPTERVRRELWERTIEFYRRLFSRRLVGRGYKDDLGGIVLRSFVEDDHPRVVHPPGHLPVHRLEGLRAYRKPFDGPDGPPLLVRLETAATPASQLWEIPDGSGRRYNSGVVSRLGVRPPGRGKLSEGAAAYDGPLMYVSLEEQLRFERDPKTRELMVARRMYLGFNQGYLGPDTTPTSHSELVGMQIGYIAANDREIEMLPLTEEYGILHPGVELVPVQPA